MDGHGREGAWDQPRQLSGGLGQAMALAGPGLDMSDYTQQSSHTGSGLTVRDLSQLFRECELPSQAGNAHRFLDVHLADWRKYLGLLPCFPSV